MAQRDRGDGRDVAWIGGCCGAAKTGGRRAAIGGHAWRQDGCGDGMEVPCGLCHGLGWWTCGGRMGVFAHDRATWEVQADTYDPSSYLNEVDRSASRRHSALGTLRTQCEMAAALVDAEEDAMAGETRLSIVALPGLLAARTAAIVALAAAE
eukprot:scaffold11921_cov102-Isochrysis_galbana.AAC.4